MRKTTTLSSYDLVFIVIIILNQLNIKKKSTKIILEKNHKKITWENTATIHSVLKKNNYKDKFLISSILKKKSTETISGKKTKKNSKKRKKIVLETL